jgi:hypothetical protein
MSCPIEIIILLEHEPDGNKKFVAFGGLVSISDLSVALANRTPPSAPFTTGVF